MGRRRGSRFQVSPCQTKVFCDLLHQAATSPSAGALDAGLQWQWHCPAGVSTPIQSWAACLASLVHASFGPQPLVASISISAATSTPHAVVSGSTSSPQPGQGQASGARRRPPSNSSKSRQPAPWLITTSLPAAFQRVQKVAQIILDQYKTRGETFPRPCPLCGSCDFMQHEPHVPQQTAIVGQSGSGDSRHRWEGREDQQGVPASGVGVIASLTEGGGPVRWDTRPLTCEQCHRWFHLGCLGIESLQEVPTLPWFHSKECRHTYLALEADAEAGVLPAWELGPKPGAFTVEVMTDADHRSYLLGAFDSGRGDMDGAYQLLSRTFPSHLLLGYGSAAAEYSGGRYTMLLKSKGEPVAVATFDAYGPHAAQLHLLATAPEAREQGHARDILDILEYRLSKVGVRRLLAQPRSEAVHMFLDKLGWEVVHPVDAAQLHCELPVAFNDAVLVEKQLL